MHPFYERLYKQNERVMKFGLDNIRTALGRENDIISYPHILIAGTNGKGQVSALFANAAKMIGMQTGLFTSPHLVEFRERMRVNSHLLPDDEIIQIGQSVLNEYGGDKTPEFSGTALTYFECCLIMALRAFRENHVNFGVFEVGLGGRLDATNALSPSLSIITSISRDHEDYLGHETAQIAREKAGIMRTGCPVICGRNEVDVLREEAESKKCASFDALGVDFNWIQKDNQILLDSKYGLIPMPGSEVLANYQRDNAAVAYFSILKAMDIGLLKRPDFNLFDSLILHTKWVGRMWKCTSKTANKFGIQQVILDGAHNPDGVRAFIEAVKSDASPHALVVNSCRDKDIDSMFPQYLSAFRAEDIFVVPVQTTSRACSPEEYCSRTGLPKTQICNSLKAGIECAAKHVGSLGTVYISGSLYLIGQAISEFNETDSLESIFL